MVPQSHKPLINYFSPAGFSKIESLLTPFQDRVSESELVRWIEHLIRLIEQFNEVAVPGYIEEFELESIVICLLSRDTFGSAILKKRNQKVLYGVRHVHFRQQLWNSMPKAMRIAIFQEKIIGAKISYQLNAILGRSTQSETPIVDVVDIGKSDTIFKIEIQQGPQACAYVLKRGWTNIQRFFEAVCTIFGKAIIASYPLFSKSESYTLLNYLPGTPLHEVDTEKTNFQNIIHECAFQAAIGDCLGRGDRHFENYLWANDHLYPLDISYMFDPDHQQWVQRYTAAGMYEVNSVVNGLASSEKTDASLDRFYKQYRTWFKAIIARKDELVDVVRAYFPTETEAYISYINQSFQKLESNIDTYQKGLTKYAINQKWRGRLDTLMQQNPQIEKDYPALKMIHLSHENRPIAFYQKDAIAPNLWHLIEDLEGAVTKFR